MFLQKSPPAAPGGWRITGSWRGCWFSTDTAIASPTAAGPANYPPPALTFPQQPAPGQGGVPRACPSFVPDQRSALHFTSHTSPALWPTRRIPVVLRGVAACISCRTLAVCFPSVRTPNSSCDDSDGPTNPVFSPQTTVYRSPSWRPVPQRCAWGGRRMKGGVQTGGNAVAGGWKSGWGTGPAGYPTVVKFFWFWGFGGWFGLGGWVRSPPEPPPPPSWINTSLGVGYPFRSKCMPVQGVVMLGCCCPAAIPAAFVGASPPVDCVPLYVPLTLFAAQFLPPAQGCPW